MSDAKPLPVIKKRLGRGAGTSDVATTLRPELEREQHARASFAPARHAISLPSTFRPFYTVVKLADAKSGDAALISGYLGKADDFDQAIGEFALAYTDQNQKDHAALVAAAKAGQIEVTIEEYS